MEVDMNHIIHILLPVGMCKCHTFMFSLCSIPYAKACPQVPFIPIPITFVTIIEYRVYPKEFMEWETTRVVG